MLTSAAAFVPEIHHDWLLDLAQRRWDNALRDWGNPSDLVQQTLLEAHQKLEGFKGTTDPVFAAWLKEILLNNLVDASLSRRRKKRDYRRKTPLDASAGDSTAGCAACLALDDPTPSKVVEATEQLALLTDSIATLPPEQQQAITLHHLRGLTVSATAAQMGRSEATVAGLLRRGLKRLGKKLRNGGSDE